MFRRYLKSVFPLVNAAGRSNSDVPLSPEAIKELLQQSERDQLEREAKVDARNVVFSSASSADHRPRIAAAEAFDVAAAALPRPPNFCYMHVSLDYSAMIDAPEVIWFNLCRANDITPSTVKPQDLHMIGGTVCQQKLGGGYIQVVLGCVPDLESDVFTFDVVPEESAIHAEGRPPPVVCFASLDTKLSLQHEHVLSSHLNTLNQRLGKQAPVIGGLYPPVNSSGNEEVKEGQLEDSLFFVNDRIFKGSAIGVILRSAYLKAKSFSVVPSISIGDAVVEDVQCENSVYTIKQIKGKAATDVIKELYTSNEMENKPSKIFLGISDNNGGKIPISFIGDPKRGLIQFTLPGDLQLKKGDEVSFLVDDTELDTEAAAGLLIGMEKQLNPIYVEKDITIAREARKSVIASSCAAFHFSHVGLNTIAKPDVSVINLGNSNTIFAPSIAQRCFGRSIPNSGFFSAGQVATVDEICCILPRSSTHCVLEGLS